MSFAIIETGGKQYKVSTTNIFLRCNNNVIKQALNLKDASDQEIFTKLRDLKDAF